MEHFINMINDQKTNWEKSGSVEYPLPEQVDIDKVTGERGLEICEDAVKTINGAKQDQYGNPEDSFDLIARYWTTYLETMLRSEFAENPIDSVELDAKDVAHMMMLLKIARMQGGSSKRDNYVDLIGYAALAEGM